jgi:hypothetical protein
MLAYTHESWEDNIREEVQWAEINTNRERSSYNVNDYFEKLQNYCSIGDSRTEYSSWRPRFNKTVRHYLHKSNTHCRAAIAKPLITESNAQMRKWWCHDHKTWTSDNWECARHMIRRVVLHVVPYIRKSLRLEITQGSLPGSNSGTRGRFCDGLSSNIMLQYSVGPIINLHGPFTVREYVVRLGNQVHPMVQTLFPTNDAVSQDESAPIHTAGTFKFMVGRAWRWTSTYSLASTVTRF